MSKFDGFTTRSVKKSKFDGFTTRPVKKTPTQSNWEVLKKALASGAISLADIPQDLAEILGNPAIDLRFGPATAEAELDQVPMPPAVASSAIKKGIKNATGFEAEPHPSNPAQKVLAHAGEFAGSMGPFGLAGKGLGLLGRFANAAKSGVLGGTIGATSGALQHAGVNPLVADIGSSLAIPLAPAASKNLLNKFSGAHNTAKTEARVGNALKKQIGEENLPKALQNIEVYNKQKKPFELQLTTPEIAQDVGLSTLARTQSNSPLLAQRNQLNNSLLLNELEKIGTTGLPESVKGESIRTPFISKYNKALERRSKETRPLYEELESIQEGVNPAPARGFLEKEIAVSSPTHKAPLERYLKSLTRNNKQPDIVTQRKSRAFKNSIKEIEDRDFSPEFAKNATDPWYEQLAQIESSSYPRPIQIENTIQELGDKANAFAKAGESNAARKYRELKKVYENVLSESPVGLEHRKKYAELSKPINEIERSPLLHNFVKKNKDVSKLEGFTLPSEKVPTKILGADLPNTKILINKTKGNRELLNLIKGSYADEILKATRLSNGNFSYDKAKKFLDNKYTKEKIKAVFNRQEQKKLDHFLDTLKRRNYVETAGKGVGSDTQQKLKIERALADSLGGLGQIVEKTALKATGFGKAGSTLLDIGRNAYNTRKNYRYNNLLEDALANPATFERIVKNPARQKTFGDFYNPYPPSLIGINNEFNREGK